MDFSLSKEEQLVRESAREFLMSRLAPLERSIDEQESIPRDFVKETGSQGLWAPTVRKEYGGSGLPLLQGALIAEEFARADTSMATAVMYLLETSWGWVLDKYGSPDLASPVLREVTSGNSFLGIASTEPEGGSDVGSIRTRADPVEGGWRIKGEKVYISGALEAKEWGGGHLLLARTSDRGHRGISMFYVRADEAREVLKLRNMGRMGISTSTVRYDSVIPRDRLVGEVDKGFYYAMDGFNHARPLVAAACVGAAEEVFRRGLDYIKTRRAFGSSLAEKQGIQFEVAELATRLEMARLVTYESAQAVHEGDPRGPELAAMAKLVAPPTALDVIKSVMMWMGGYGYTRDAGIERSLRASFSYMVGAEGALNVMKQIIAKRVIGI